MKPLTPRTILLLLDLGLLVVAMLGAFVFARQSIYAFAFFLILLVGCYILLKTVVRKRLFR
jgi:hypothetical protein